MVLLSLLAGLSLSSTANEKKPFPAEIETLYGYISSHKGITFQVKSNGCTQKEDFSVRVKESWPLQVLLIRDDPDLCRGVTRDTQIKFSYEEMGLNQGDQYRIINPSGINTVSFFSTEPY